MSLSPLHLLQLTQLLDTTFPIGAAAHSLGIETLTSEGVLTTAQLASFLHVYLAEVGAQEGLFCRLGHALWASPSMVDDWLALNRRVSAFKLAREPRKASAMMGKRFLQMVCALEPVTQLQDAYTSAIEAQVDIHHAPAFGLTAAALGIDADSAVAAYLQQATLSLISASQRLLSLGQSKAAQILWDLKPQLLAVAQKSADSDPLGPASYSFSGLVEMAGMRHPVLPMRLFIS
jgi:urease accessory protein